MSSISAMYDISKAGQNKQILKEEEVRDLLRKAKQGDDLAWNNLIDGLTYLVVKISKGYESTKIDFKQILSKAKEALVDGLKNYKFDGDFYQYINNFIEKKMNNFFDQYIEKLLIKAGQPKDVRSKIIASQILDEEEAIKLLNDYRKGNANAGDILFTSLMKYCISILKDYSNAELSFEDLYSETTLVVTECITREYKSDCGLYSFIEIKIRENIEQYIKNNNSSSPIDCLLEEDRYDIESNLVRIDEILLQLPSLHRMSMELTGVSIKPSGSNSLRIKDAAAILRMPESDLRSARNSALAIIYMIIRGVPFNKFDIFKKEDYFNEIFKAARKIKDPLEIEIFLRRKICEMSYSSISRDCGISTKEAYLTVAKINEQNLKNPLIEESKQEKNYSDEFLYLLSNYTEEQLSYGMTMISSENRSILENRYGIYGLQSLSTKQMATERGIAEDTMREKISNARKELECIIQITELVNSGKEYSDVDIFAIRVKYAPKYKLDTIKDRLSRMKKNILGKTIQVMRFGVKGTIYSEKEIIKTLFLEESDRDFMFSTINEFMKNTQPLLGELNYKIESGARVKSCK